MVSIALEPVDGLSTVIWAGLFPIIAYYILGSENGAIAHILFSLILVGALIFGFHNHAYNITVISLANIVGVLIALGILVYFYETAQTKALQTVFEYSTSDELTGAGNRKLLPLFFQKEKESSLRHMHPLTIIMIDIDHFKNINDHFGHLAGDHVLISFVQLLQENLRETDLIFRWGGEEFIVLFPKVSLEHAHLVAEKIRKKIENTPFDPVIKLTASFGITEILHNESNEETIRRLDTALYSAKKNGRNRVEVV